MRRAEAALVVAKAAKMTADEKVTADRRRTARAAVKAAEDAKAAAVSVAASQAHDKLRQVVAGLQQSQAAINVVQEASELWNASLQVEAQLKQEQMREQARSAAFKAALAAELRRK
jgi:hypothetical protein